MESILSELDELGGYVSDSRFAPGFGDEGIDKDVGNIIVVDNLPIVPEAKYAKLIQFMTKTLNDIVNPPTPGAAPSASAIEGFTMPKNKEGMSEGFAFVEFKTKADAEKCQKATDGWQFDANHKLSVMRYDSFQQYRDEPEEFVPPEAVTWQAQPDRFYWMSDEHGREEFCLRYSNSEKAPGPGEREKHETEVLYAEMRGPPALDYGGDKQKAANLQWSTSYIRWSPRGTYLVTMHPQGAKLWSGKGFKEGLRLQHVAVNEILWSPDERFLGTWNGRPFNQLDHDKVNPREALILWDVRTGTRIRSFPQRRVQIGELDFAFSADSRFLARIEVDTETNNLELIRVYEAPTFHLLENRSIKAVGARDLMWSPKRVPLLGSPLLAYWTPERDNSPTTVYVMKLPSKEYVRIRPLQQVGSVELQWHPQGDFLAVISEKLSKSQARKKNAGDKVGLGIPQSKGISAGYIAEFFRTSTKEVPIEVLDVKERISNFAWEPHGSRFAMMLGDGPNKFTVAVYQLPDGKGAPVHLFSLEDREVNTLHWSPKGEFLILAGLTSNQGRLEFFDVSTRRTMNVVSHDVANGLIWDPSGRMVATIKTQHVGGAHLTRDTVANGYILWTFQGVKIYEAAKPKLFQFAWRPRAEGLLTDEETKEVTKNLKKYVQKYQHQDKERQERSALLGRLRKRKARDEFRAFLAERNADFEANRPLRIEMGIESEEAQSVLVFEEVVEGIVKEEVSTL